MLSQRAPLLSELARRIIPMRQCYPAPLLDNNKLGLTGETNMAIEAALIKPVVDAIMRVLEKRKHARLKQNAEEAIREAIRELLLADPNENEVDAKLAIAKAADLISRDVLLAEQILQKVKASKKPAKKKAARKA
jgi:hypothetical protein